MKAGRLESLQALLRAQQDTFNAAAVGRSMPVLFERLGRHPGQLAGRTPYMQAVHAEAPAAALGEIHDVRIVECHANSLAGRIAAFAGASAEAAAMRVDA